MARAIRNARLNTRSARTRLKARREPYWTVISEGCALGYRRGAKGGYWIAKFRDEFGQRRYDAIGAADDARDPDGVSALSFAQAQERARKFFVKKAREAAGDLAPLNRPYTIDDALNDYFRDYAKRGKALSRTQSAANLHLRPALGAIPLAKLTAKRLRDWQHGLADKGRQVRGKRGELARETNRNEMSRDGPRRRRASANRILTVLKAALNHAWREGMVPSDEAWRRVSPFKSVAAPVIRYLSDDEARRIVNACAADFRDLVRGALLTGCRYGELIALHASDYDAEAGTLIIRETKAGKVRHVVLTDEASNLFNRLTIGRPRNAHVFIRADGRPWGASHQQRPLMDACQRAGISPAITFHILRHSHASALAMRGVPMGVIAAQLGHADTRMTEKHYAHLAPSYVADTIRANFPTLGIEGNTSLVHLGFRRVSGK